MSNLVNYIRKINEKFNILEKITWVPHNFITWLKDNHKSPIKLKLRQLNIPEDFEVYLPEDDKGLSAQLRVAGLREPINFEYYYKFINKDDIVLDLGANAGIFSLLSKKAKKIICVEPLPGMIPYIIKNLVTNNLRHKAVILNMAVGEKGKLLLEIDDKMNFSRIVKEKTKKTIEVDSITLKELAKKYKTNVVRLDVEGYEYNILYKKTPKEINKISMELHRHLLEDKQIEDMMKYFEQEGFNMRYLIECIPDRLNPFYNILKKTGLLKKITYVKENLTPTECLPFIFEGRAIKYLFLERK